MNVFINSKRGHEKFLTGLMQKKKKKINQLPAGQIKEWMVMRRVNIYWSLFMSRSVGQKQ